MDRPNQHSQYLDVIRGSAALIVVAGHLRNFLFVDSLGPQNYDVLWTGFYLVTGLAHQAVVVFFVMSGFLVGRSVYLDYCFGRFSWRVYTVKRLTRLWLVLLPALLLTAFFDWLGRDIYHNVVYLGKNLALYHSTPRPELIPSAYSPITAIGNSFFLQTVAVPTFGTNGPLWSLANEFWYYVIFPILLGMIFPGLVWKKILYLAAAAALIILLPQQILIDGLIWLFGFLVSLAVEKHHRVLARAISPLVIICISAAFFAVLCSSKLLKTTLYGDFGVGIAFSALLYVLSTLKGRPIIPHKLYRWSANISYTLYLTHFPLFMLLLCLPMVKTKMVPSLFSLALFSLGLVIAIAYASIIYLVFERNTPRVQRFFLRLTPHPHHLGHTK